MRRLLLLLLLAALTASCTQNTGGSFTEAPTPLPTGPAARAQLDLKTLGTVRAQAAVALVSHLHAGVLDPSWGAGAPPQVAGPYSDAAPEAEAMALQALRSLAVSPSLGSEAATGQKAAVTNSATQAFKQLDGPRGGAYLLLVDAAHPAAPSGPYAVDPAPTSCATPVSGAAQPECLSRQVSDGLMAAWYAPDSKMFFQVGETSTVYRPVDAIAVGCALLVAGFQLHDEQKIQAGTNIVQKEMKTDVDNNYGFLAGLVTATATGGHQVTDYNTRLADHAGAVELLLEAFDYSRENQYMVDAQKLLQPLLDERIQLHEASGGYIPGFDLQSSGPPDHGPSDTVATLLVLQAARHYDRDDGGHFAHLEETAAGALTTLLDADRKQGGDPATGLPATVPESGSISRSGLVTALAVVVLGDVLRDFGGAGPSPSPSPS
jgi:hypothetical protein